MYGEALLKLGSIQERMSAQETDEPNISQLVDQVLMYTDGLERRDCQVVVFLAGQEEPIRFTKGEMLEAKKLFSNQLTSDVVADIESMAYVIVMSMRNRKSSYANGLEMYLELQRALGCFD